MLYFILVDHMDHSSLAFLLNTIYYSLICVAVALCILSTIKKIDGNEGDFSQDK